MSWAFSLQEVYKHNSIIMFHGSSSKASPHMSLVGLLWGNEELKVTRGCLHRCSGESLVVSMHTRLSEVQHGVWRPQKEPLTVLPPIILERYAERRHPLLRRSEARPLTLGKERNSSG